MAVHTHKNYYSFPTAGGSDIYGNNSTQKANNPDQKLI